VYQGFRQGIGKSFKMIIFVSLLTTLNVSNTFEVSFHEIGLSPKPNKQIKLV